MSNLTLSHSAATCFDAQTFLGSQNEYDNGQMNPDVGGACNAISNISINLLLPFLVAWSPDVSPSIFLLLTQTIPTLVSTLSNIHSDNLSLFDAHFTVAVTASPMSVYLAGSCVLHLFGVHTSLFNKIASSEARKLILILGLLLPWLWLSVNLVSSFSTTAFRNSSYCRGMSIPRFMEFLLISSFTGVLDVLGRRDLWDDLTKRLGLGLLSLLGLWLWGIYLVRHREDILRKCQLPVQEDPDLHPPQNPSRSAFERKSKLPRANGLRLMKRCITLGWRVPRACWQVVMSKHPVMMVWMLLCLHWSWALGISRALVFERDQLSYGQVLSLFAPIPGLWSFIKIVIIRWQSIKKFVKNVPNFLSEGGCFIVTGRETWSSHTGQQVDRDYFHWSRWRWGGTLIGSFVWVGLHIVWITFYVLTGTVPNERNVTNEPHRNWKPYSVCMFINGYLVSIVCMFVCVACFDFHHKKFFPGRSQHDGSEVGSTAEHRPDKGLARRVLRTFSWMISLILAVAICSAPLFAPYAALPLSQQWNWDHQCDRYPAEIILEGQSEVGLPSRLSFFVTRADSSGYPPKRDHLYNFTFSNILTSQGLKVLEYSPPVDSEHAQPPANLTDPQTVDSITQLCSGDSGTYTQEPYLSFVINTTTPSSSSTPSSAVSNITYLRAESKEYAYVDDAPSFSLRYRAGPDETTLGDILLRSALTKRNHPQVLKVCSNSVVPSTEVLAPLSVVMVALNKFSIFIARPRVYSM